MELTFSAIKADVGSKGGHTEPSAEQLAAVRRVLADAPHGLLLDHLVTFTGDDIALLMTHREGPDSATIHQLAWSAFEAATAVAKDQGLYAAGQDLLVDAPSGNIRGAGPGVAEVEFDHKLAEERPAESFIVFAADKCSPGAYNLPLYLAFADTMHNGGLLLAPKMSQGFTLRIMDMDYSAGDRVIDLNTVTDVRMIQALLRDETRYAISAAFSNNYPGQQVLAASTSRLHNVKGTYTGKDDPIAVVRSQGIFPAPEELTSPFKICPFVTGDARGSHVMALTPYPVNNPVRLAYCQPIVSAMAFSLDRAGRFSHSGVDLFADSGWNRYRELAGLKSDLMRAQGWFGVAMASNPELAYTGITELYNELESSGRWRVLAEHEPVLTHG